MHIPRTTPRRSDASAFSALDPFALPTETRGRYRILIAAALIVAWGSAVFVTPGLAERPERLVLDPEHQALYEKILEQGLSSLTMDEWRLAADPNRVRPYAVAIGIWLGRMAVSTALVLASVGAAVAFYRLHPRWRGLARHAVPLTEDEAPRIVGEVRRLIDHAGLPGTIRLARLPGGAGGLAFGTQGRETLALCCPPDLLEVAWDRLLRPVAYHELGHIANRDIRYQEASRGIWLAMVLVLAIAAPLGRSLAPAATAPPMPWLEVVRHVPFLLAIAWFWVGLVRVREYYADLRVAAWGERASLRRRLAVGMTPQPEPRARRRSRLTAALPALLRLRERLRDHGWSFHPTPAHRLSILEDPGPIFRVSSGLAFLTGLLVTAVLAPLGLLAQDLTLVARSLITLIFPVAAPLALLSLVAVGLGGILGLAYLVAGALGVQVQREAVARLAVGPSSVWGYAHQGWVALLFALGLEVGLLSTSSSFLLAPVSPLYVLAWVAAFTALTWMWLAYVTALSRFLLGSQAGTEPPRARQALVSGLSIFLLAVLYSPALAARVSLYKVGDPDVMASLGRLSEDPSEAFVIVFVMSCLVLLAASLFVFALVGLGSTVFVAVWIRRRRQSCSACGAPIAARLVAGRRCESCGAPLAPWLLMNRPALPAGGRDR